MSGVAAYSTRIAGLDWTGIATHLTAEGYALLPGVLGEDEARGLARDARAAGAGRRAPLASSDLPWTVDQWSFGASLPPPWAAWRTGFYRHLAVTANHWNDLLGVGDRYPAQLEDFRNHNGQAGQTRPQSYVSILGAGDYLPLHQRGDGQRVFPFQVIALLSEPGSDFRGGEFLMTEQRPRMQSRPVVLPLKLGDAAIIATSVRPCKGARGHYRVNLKHAISRLHCGERIGVELTFHDAR